MSHCSCALRHNSCSLSKQHILILHYSTVRFVQSWMYGGKKYADCPQQNGRWIFLLSYSISHTRTPFLYTKRSIFCGIDDQASLLSVGTMKARSAFRMSKNLLESRRLHRETENIQSFADFLLYIKLTTEQPRYEYYKTRNIVEK